MLSFVPRSFGNIKFIGKDFEKIVKSVRGKDLLHLAEENHIHIPNACEGSGACATCQLYVKKGSNALSKAKDSEYDTLDFAVKPRDESRLACQAIVDDESADIEVEIPLQSRNIV